MAEIEDIGDLVSQHGGVESFMAKFREVQAALLELNHGVMLVAVVLGADARSEAELAQLHRSLDAGAAGFGFSVHRGIRKV